MKKISNFFSGKKTYITAGLIFIIGGSKSLQVASIIPEFPDYIWAFISTIVGSFGLYAVRDAIKKVEK